jgi:hypothetical protein
MNRPARIMRSKLVGAGQVGEEARPFEVPAPKAVITSSPGFEEESPGLVERFIISWI